MQTLSTFFLTSALLVGAACGKTSDGADQADTGSPSDGASPDVTAEVAETAPELRPDGCPKHTADFRGTCESVGKVCKYPDQCSATNPSYAVYTCTKPSEGPTTWRGGTESCSLLKGPDGCPLGDVGSPPWCEEAGKKCSYRRCDDAGTSGTVVTYVCKAWETGFMFFEESRIPCGAGG